MKRGNQGIGGGRPLAYPELSALAVGSACVIPWRVDARGVMLGTLSQRALSRAAQRMAARNGWAIVCQGSGLGLRVTRTA